jgi:nucleoside-diphosphate-sugar epimerase
MAKILVTGGYGFVGFHLTTALLSAGHTVVIANRARKAIDPELAALLALPNVSVIEIDLSDSASIEKLGQGYDFVYHLASINGFKQFKEIPHEVMRVGVQSTLNILEWFYKKNGKSNAKILFTSTCEVYLGALNAYGTLPLPTPESAPGVIPDPYNPRWSYGGQKLICELLFIHYAHAYDFRMSIVRLHYLYGPRVGRDSMIPRMITQILERTDPFTLMGKDDSRSFCYIADAVSAMTAIIESEKCDGETYNIGSDVPTTIDALTNLLFEVNDWHPQTIEYLDSPDGKINHFLPDITKIKQDTGWKPATSLIEGLQKTSQWYKA